MIFARKMPEFYVIIAETYFSRILGGGGTRASPAPVSCAYEVNLLCSKKDVRTVIEFIPFPIGYDFPFVLSKVCSWESAQTPLKGNRTLRHRDTSAPQNWCGSLSQITGGAVSHRNCPGSKCPGFSSITTLVSKCLVPRFCCRSVLRSVPKCP